MYKIIVLSTLLTMIHTYNFKTQNITNYSTELAEYMLKFAGLSYCYKDEIIESKCCPELVDEGWIAVDIDQIEEAQYDYVIFRHDKYKKVVISVPGTRSCFQLIEEIRFSYGMSTDEDPTVKIMSYFYWVYTLLKDKIHNSLEKVFKRYPDYQYVFTGHSLGGAIANILAFDAIKFKSINRTETSPVLITYGQPRTGNDVFSNEVMKLIPYVYRIVREGDIIADIPCCYWTYYFFGSCSTILPNNKFDKDLIITEKQKNISLYYFYLWHSGGLKLYNFDMDKYLDCGDEYGDNHIDSKCVNHRSLSLYNHVFYFGSRVSEICRKSSIGSELVFLE
jgi:hypothetical protein